MIPLEFLQAGEIGNVLQVLGDERIVTQLAEKGLREGCQIEVIRAGNPVVLRLGATQLTLRTQGQIEIFVQITPS